MLRLWAMSLVVAQALAGAPPARAEDSADPWCSGIAPGDWDGQNCRLPGRDGAILTFDYRKTEDGHRLYFTETAPSGKELFKVGPLYLEDVVLAPDLRDVTGDGVAELFVPYSGGMFDIWKQIWRAGPEGWHHAGDIGGIEAASLHVENGLILTTEQESIFVYRETARRVTRDGLVTAYVLERDLAAERCRIVNDDGLEAAGLTAEAVLAQCNR